jgi:4-alpha-glucanotransferase
VNVDAWGIYSAYEDAQHVRRVTPPETQSAIRSAMGDPLEPSHGCDVQVVRHGSSPALPVPAELRLEDGTRLKLSGRLPPDVPLGYHELRVPGGLRPTRLIVAPPACAAPPPRTWGWAVQVYAARSQQSWGIGDLADLRRLAEFSASLGAGLLLLNPMGAVAPVAPQEASPYYPTSRRFKNPLYLHLEDVPGAGPRAQQLAAFSAAARALNQQRRIDRNAVLQLKMQSLATLWAGFSGSREFENFCAAHGEPLRQFAAFCFLSEQHGGNWRLWPAELRRPDAAAVQKLIASDNPRLRFHQWLQWLLDEQLRAAAAALPLVQDLPIGFDPAGFDAWTWQDLLAHGCTIGAPPDIYNALGQDWGLPPFVPHKLRSAGYEPFIQTIRSALRHAGGLRIDHVMGLFRLYWIPQGFGPAHGTYVRYAADELLAILAVESARSGAFVIGEDLGTVEGAVREELAARQVLSCRLLVFESAPPADFPSLALAAATTHDLPTLAGLWSGSDLAAQKAIGLAPDEAAFRAMRERIRSLAGVPDDAAVSRVIERAYQRLAESPCAVIVAQLEDALAVEERPNMPATITQWPNWSLALPGGLEALQAAPLALRIAQAVARTRAH